MTSLGLSQAQLAERLSVSRESVSQWLKGSKFPRPAALLALGRCLGLLFRELVLVEDSFVASPEVAYRTNRKRQVNSKDKTDALDMAEGLALLDSYLPPPSLTAPMTFVEPSTDREFVVAAGQHLRRLLGAGEEPIDFAHLVREVSAQGVYLIPVLWGPNGHDALHVRLPAQRRTYIYLNLDKKWSDIRFWLLHEWTHVLTPTLHEGEAEFVADSIPGEVLYPQTAAESFLRGKNADWPDSHWITALVAEADSLEISPITVSRQVQLVASREGKTVPDPDIYPAWTTRLKAVPSAAQKLLGSESPTVETYLNEVPSLFGTPVFAALSQMIRDRGVSSNFVERVLRVSLGDARGIHGNLARR